MLRRDFIKFIGGISGFGMSCLPNIEASQSSKKNNYIIIFPHDKFKDIFFSVQNFASLDTLRLLKSKIRRIFGPNSLIRPCLTNLFLNKKDLDKIKLITDKDFLRIKIRENINNDYYAYGYYVTNKKINIFYVIQSN